jgi:hypothetical protein
MEIKLSDFDFKYSVDDQGNVFSLKGKKKKLKGKVSKNGYRTLLINHNGIRKYVLEHRLILLAFDSNINNKRTVNHKDGNKLNNVLSNLEWSTDSENQNHAIDNGLINHKINYMIAEQIRNDKGSYRELAIKYGIGKTNIGYIKSNKRWKTKK